MTAASIIRQHPNKSAKELVELCAAKGVPTTLGNVYAARSNDKRRGRKPTAPKSADPIRSAVERFAADIVALVKADVMQKLGAIR